MSGPGAIMREIHRWRRHAKDLQTKLDQAPRLLKAQQDKLARQEDNLSQLKETIKRLRLKTNELEVSLKATQQQEKKYEKQMDEAAGKKEYDALRHEIDQAQKTVVRLNDEILETMMAAEEHTAQIPAAEKALQKAREDFALYEKDWQERLASWTEQRQQALRQLAEVEASLPEEFQDFYQRLVKTRGDDALATVNNRICESCYTEITPQMNNDLLRSLFVLCKNCGRILYLPESQ